MVNIMHGRNLMKIENMISSRGYRRIHQGRGVWCVQARGLRARIRVIFLSLLLKSGSWSNTTRSGHKKTEYPRAIAKRMSKEDIGLSDTLLARRGRHIRPCCISRSRDFTERSTTSNFVEVAESEGESRCGWALSDVHCKEATTILRLLTSLLVSSCVHTQHPAGRR